MRYAKVVGLGVLLAATVLAACQNVAFAHPYNYGAVWTSLNIQDSNIALHTKAPQQIITGAPDEAAKQALEQEVNQHFTIAYNKQPCPFKLTAITPKASQTTFDGVFACASPVEKIQGLTIHSDIFANLFQNFDHFVTVTQQAQTVTLVFTPSEQDYPPKAKDASSSNFLTVTEQFIWMGVEHIWTGYDHILFLISVILLLRSIKKILVVVTSFTVAHSITLILAGLGIITLPARIVEPLIALTIIFVAARNLTLLAKRQKGDTHLTERWAMTAGFGLIHGLGFAGALLETGVPKDYFVPSLVFFNVGVELGQIGLLLILVPLMVFIKRFPWRRKALMGLSAAIVLLASLWFFQRLFGV